MLIPVLIGGAAMALVSYIPYVSFINCACCAGIMGGAVLGVWFYKKSYPSDQAFGPKQGAKIGALSGIVGAVVYTLLSITLFSGMSPGDAAEFDQALEESIAQMEAQGQDPAAVEQVSNMIKNVMESPMLLSVIILGFSLIIFIGFGAIGGAIGGKIFKSVPVEPEIPPMSGGDEI
jgi:hypothetical protein